MIRGAPPEKNGVLRDYLARDRAERKTYVVPAPDRNARLAVLHYELLSQANGLSLVRVSPETGRTHQIRCQFASRDLPIAGDRKYSTVPADYPIALWSGYICFQHPGTERTMEFAALPPAEAPWDCFSASLAELRNHDSSAACSSALMRRRISRMARTLCSVPLRFARLSACARIRSISLRAAREFS